MNLKNEQMFLLLVEFSKIVDEFYDLMKMIWSYFYLKNFFVFVHFAEFPIKIKKDLILVGSSENTE
jgi:hypothetical protein